jgi:hypothetical protein
VSGDVESAGGRSRSATVAPRYLFAQGERRAEVSAVVTPGAGDVVPFGSEFEVAIEEQRTVCSSNLLDCKVEFLNGCHMEIELLLPAG